MQGMNAETGVERLLQQAYTDLKEADAVSARKHLEEALRQNFENPEVKYSLMCIKWWLDRMGGIDQFREPYDKAGYIMSQWKAWYSFLDRVGEAYDSCQYAVRHYVFNSALRYFEEILGDRANRLDPVLMLQIGRCYKGVGNYEEALKCLEQSVKLMEDGEALAELADVNALLMENRAAKALFREAFFLDPQKVDLRDMESEVIVRLRDYVASLGYRGPELAEWIPVYGTLMGVFSVKRELRPVELGRLKQSIFSLENDIRSNPAVSAVLKPRLINRYFWLIDHCENIQACSNLVEDTKLKLKLIDRAIFDQYVR
jgi:tetratricopeptide (TPR) repeat protein